MSKSTLLLKTSSRFEIGHKANLVINAGDTLKIQPCATLIIKGDGKLIVNIGGVLCISNGAIIATDKGMANIVLNPGYKIGLGFLPPHLFRVPQTTEITGTVTWNNTIFLVNTLTINPGAHLTVTNSTIIFGHDLSHCADHGLRHIVLSFVRSAFSI